jgi:hypothetical protein
MTVLAATGFPILAAEASLVPTLLMADILNQ